jgi:hypothetical protein
VASTRSWRTWRCNSRACKLLEVEVRGRRGRGGRGGRGGRRGRGRGRGGRGGKRERAEKEEREVHGGLWRDVEGMQRDAEGMRRGCRGDAEGMWKEERGGGDEETKNKIIPATCSLKISLKTPIISFSPVLVFARFNISLTTASLLSALHSSSSIWREE